MKSFFKRASASCFGTILAFLLIVGLLGIAMTIYITKDKPNQKGLLHISISGSIPDHKHTTISFENLQQTGSSTSYWDLRNKIKAASTDKNIKGIYLEVTDADITQSITSEIIELLKEFKSSGKKIYAYSYYYNQNAFLLTSIADSIYLNPNGGIDLKGYGMYAPFFKNLLDKLDIKINMFYAGKYKGSTEPYRLNGFSDQNKFQLRNYLNQIHQHLVKNLAQNRNIEEDRLQKIIDLQNPYDAQFMKEEGLVDDLLFYDEFEILLERDFKTKELVPLAQYKKSDNVKNKGEIALVFAEGEISWGEAENSINHKKYSKIFQEIKKDDHVKAVVLRLNSPGGSGYTSDLLHREIKLLQKSGKRVYASIGSMATSGAYYIASACDSIITTENSMTGSIGVYIMLPSFDQFLKNKVGISVDSVATAKNTIAYNTFFPISENETENLQKETEELYQQFINKVSEGRKISRDSVHQIAQGRIWTGTEAVSLGLADCIGSLESSLQLVAEKNGLSVQSIKVYPNESSSILNRVVSESVRSGTFLQNMNLNFLEQKTTELQKLMKNPTPSMSFPHPFYVIKL